MNRNTRKIVIRNS